jgi:hypothetical protein
MSKKALTIWFDDKGNMLEQSYGHMTSGQPAYQGGPVYFSEIAENFVDRLEYVNLTDYYRGKSRVALKSITSHRTYSIYVDHFNKIILADRFVNKMIDGEWRFIKHGTGQAIELILPPKP